MSIISSTRSISACKLVPPTFLASRTFSVYSSLRSNRFNVLFCGSDEFSVKNLDTLLAAPDVWEEIQVLTPRLRKSPIPLLEYADKRQLVTAQVPKEGIAGYQLPESFTNAGDTKRNILVTASFGHIIPNSLLAQFDNDKRLNVHPSLLPRYRGAAPIQWTIANGDTETGVSVQRLVEKGKGIDGGDVVGSVGGIPVTIDATYQTLLKEVSSVGADLLVAVLRQIQNGTDNPIPQDPSNVTRAPKITLQTARIDWASSVHDIARLARGIAHQYPLWTTLDGVALQLFNPTPVPSPVPPEEQENVRPGTARLLRKQGQMIVACADGTWLGVERVKSQGKREVGVNDWWNGLPKGLREGKSILFE